MQKRTYLESAFVNYLLQYKYGDLKSSDEEICEKFSLNEDWLKRNYMTLIV